MRRLAIGLVAACGGKVVPHPVAKPIDPIVAIDPIKAWMARIPAACRIEPPIPDLDCPTPPPIPNDACIVEQRDLERDLVVDRFVFDRGRVLRVDTTISSNQESQLLFAYDASGRLIRKTTCLTSRAGDPSWELGWREPLARYDAPFSSVEREERVYATPTAHVPSFGDTVRTTRADTTVESFDMRICYALDHRERRTERFQVFRMSDRPTLFDTTINHYDYPALAPDAASEAGPRTITHVTLNLDHRPEGGFSVRYKGEFTSYLSYDNRGLMIAAGTGSFSPNRLEYDDRGRLTSFGGIRVAWASPDRIVAITGIGPGYDRTYRYDAAGRMTEATYGTGQGYRLIYGARCPRDFRHPAIAPNIDNLRYYEGKDTL